MRFQTNDLSMVRGIRFISMTFHIFFGGRGSCRYEPSCTEYAAKAIKIFGPLRGGQLFIRRLLRCHPFGGRGWDPVPN